MSIRNHLTGTLGATHLFMLEDATRDSGSNGLVVNLTEGVNTSFAGLPQCLGVNASLLSTTTPLTKLNGAVIDGSTDINSGSDIYRKRTMNLWFSSEVTDDATCIFEQGGGTNNFAFTVGIGGAIAWQAADAGQPFLIRESLAHATANRQYMITGIWEHHTEHAGSGNRILFYVNGILQGVREGTGTAVFPSHTGDNVLGNTDDNLQSYGGATLGFYSQIKRVNMLSMHNDISLTQPQIREIFERTTPAEHTIAPSSIAAQFTASNHIGTILVADTVEQQQVALDTLIGDNYPSHNCCIRIIQATDATDYTLLLDNQTFNPNSDSGDIDIQYVGSNTLTIVNVNGSNATMGSTPPEIDIDGTNIVTGGGTLVIESGAYFRYNLDNEAPVNLMADRVYINGVDTYDMVDWTISEFVQVEDNTGAISLITGGFAVTINQGVGNTVTINDTVNITFAGMPTGLGATSTPISIEELDGSFASTGNWIDVYSDSVTGAVTVPLQPNTNYRWKADAEGYFRSNDDTWVNFTTTGSATIPVNIIEIHDAFGAPIYGNGDPAKLALMSFDMSTLECRFVNTTGAPITFDFEDAFDFLDEKLTSHFAMKAGLRQFTFDPTFKKIISPSPPALTLNDNPSNNARCYLDFVVLEQNENNPRTMLASPFNTVHGLEMAHSLTISNVDNIDNIILNTLMSVEGIEAMHPEGHGRVK